VGAAKAPSTTSVAAAVSEQTNPLRAKRSVVSTDLHQTLSAFMAGDPEARAALPVLLHDRLKARARALAQDLSDRHLVDDVVSRTWELVLSKPAGSYHPQRSAPMTYLNTIARTAVRDVRSTSQTVVRSVRDYTEIDIDLPDLIEPLTDGGLAAVDDAIDLESRMAALGPRARVAARMIAYEGAALTTAAERVGLSRFALKRQLTSWATAAA
jgi:DNA-directed RNA polymerase specialized sigma24 family protein